MPDTGPVEGITGHQIPRAGHDIDVRRMGADQRGGPHRCGAVVNRQYHERDRLQGGAAEQLRIANVAIEHRVSFGAPFVHQGGIGIEGDVGDAAAAEDGADGMAEAAIAGDDGARTGVMCVRWREPGFRCCALLPRKPRAPARTKFGQDGGEHHGQRNHCDGGDKELVADHACRLGCAEHHKAELAALGQQQRHPHCRAAASAEAQAQDVDERCLDADDGEHMDAQFERMLHQRLDVDRHADGNEKQAHQQTFVGFHRSFNLQTVARGGQHHAHQKSTQRHRHAGVIHRQRGDKHGCHCRQKKRFAVIVARQIVEQARHYVVPARCDGRHHRNRDAYFFPERRAQVQHTGVRQNRHRRQQRHHGEVLHQQDGERGLPVRCRNLAFVAQQLHHDGSGRQREAGTGQQCDRPAELKQPEVQRDQQCRHHDLQRAESKQHAPQIPQPARIHLQPDQKHQQHHAELGELAHAVDVGRDGRPRCVGADDDTGDQQTEDGAEAEMPEHGYRKRRDHQQQHC